MRIACALFVMVAIVGCSQPKLDQPAVPEAKLFGPTAMRIHPIFTEVKDWTNDGVPDGIEALIEFQDQFGDPAKAVGELMFELYDYRKGDPEPRGLRLSNPWFGPISTLQDQKARWNRTSRTYSFLLAMPGITRDKSYVLTASFRASSGGRFFDTAVLPAQQETPGATTQPAATPNP